MQTSEQANHVGPRKIGRYVIQREIGHGGMAVVYLAYDPNFTRQVAIKVMPRELIADPGFRTRFLREAQTIATLEHPAIVPVYDYGEEEGQPYLVMRYMPGGALDQRLNAEPLSLPKAATLYSRLAPALDEAHSRGLIHRDLKPGNILFDQRDDAYLSDFGIVKLTETTTSLTAGAIVGTPAYMSPEQGRGQKDIDGRADIYSLGAILFHILTGRLPYEADTPTGQIICHINEPVPDILAARRDLPYELQHIIDHSMAKHREDRYNTVSEMARALAQIAAEQSYPGELTATRVPSVVEQTPVVAIPVIPTDLSKPSAGVASSMIDSGQSVEAEFERISPVVTVKTPSSLEHVRPAVPFRSRLPGWFPALLLPVGLVVIVLLVLGGRGIYRVVVELSGIPGTPSAAIAYPSESPLPGLPTDTGSTPGEMATPTTTRLPILSSLLTPTPLYVTLAGTPAPAPSVVITADTADQVVQLARWGKGSILQTAWSPDGKWLAVGTMIGIYIYEPYYLAEKFFLPTPFPISCVAISPDGTLIAIGGKWSSRIEVWNVNDRSLSVVLKGHQGSISSLAFSPDGKLFASGSSDRTIRLWKSGDSDLLKVFEGHSDEVHNLVFSADSQYLASASPDHTFRLWDVLNGKEIRSFQFPLEQITDFALSPDLQWLAIGGWDHAVHLVRTSDGKEERSFSSDSVGVRSLAFSPASDMLATGDESHSVRIWRVSDGELLRELTNHDYAVLTVLFSPDSTLLASGSEDGALRVWRLEDGVILAKLDGFTFSNVIVSISPEKDVLVKGLFSGEVEIWNISSASFVNSYKAQEVYLNSLIFSATGEYLVAGSDRGARKLRVADGAVIVDFISNTSPSTSFALSLDGKLLAVGYANNQVQLFDASSGNFIHTITGHQDAVTSLAFSPDGQFLASGARDNTARIWSLADWSLQTTLANHNNWVTRIVFSPDGKTLATASRDNLIRLWKVSDGILIQTMSGHTGAVYGLGFSSDVSLIVSGSDDATLKIWRVIDGHLLATLTGHTFDITSASFTPDGMYIVSGSYDGTVRLWGIK